MDDLLNKDNEEAVETLDPQDADEGGTEATEPEKFEKERYNQIIEGKNAEVKKFEQIAINAAIKSAEIDALSLIDLHKTDPKLAEKVATRLVDHNKTPFRSYKDAERYIKSLQKDQKPEDDFDARYNEKRAREVHQEAVTEAYEYFDTLPEGAREQAIAEFDELAGDRLLTRQTGKKYAEAARLLVSKGKSKDEKLLDAKLDAGNSGVGTGARNKASGAEKKVEFKDGSFYFV